MLEHATRAFSLSFSLNTYRFRNPRNNMVGVSSLDSTGVAAKSNSSTIKFLCSYGGKILPRYPDGKLRYVGGETRVLAVDRSISFAELLLKLGKLCGSSVSLRCQLPSEDLDALVSITSDEDLANLIEEYDIAASSTPHLKIRAFLSPPKSIKKTSPTPSATSSSSVDAASSKSPSYASFLASCSTRPGTAINRCVHQIYTPAVFPFGIGKYAGQNCYYACHAQGNPRPMYLVHNGNHWQ